ncbi:cell envelope integrity protein TolA [uncultured Massilia sp.]|uniref:cell envelope integrity protein TolA n=1 Tax=uncultured Massilia sp. TaxID=169973 RepID=UPI00258D3836|nr:cell envelope integrity protein TolA [uncultured Massilia sp.]
MTTGFQMGSSRWCLAVSVGLHAALAVWLYHAGYTAVVRRQDTDVAASVQATARAGTQARMARRMDDLKKIKELLEQSTNRTPQPAPPEATAETEAEPERMLKQAREMSRAIDELGRELKAEELARLTARTKEEARAEVDAEAPPDPPPDPAGSTDPASELAGLEARARAVLAGRAEQLARERNGVQIERQAAGTGLGSGIGEGSASGQGHAPGGPPPGAQGLAAEEIARFMREGTEPEREKNSRVYKSGIRDIFASAKGVVPGVDAARMVRGRGRMFGAGGQYANRIYLNSWYIIGPFEGNHGRELFDNPKYPPEDAVLLDAVYYGKDKRLVKWEYLNTARYPLVPRGEEENAVYYGYTEVFMDRERDMLVWIGADDDASVKVNDRLIWKGGDSGKRWFYQSVYTGRTTYQRDYNRTEGQRQVRFRKGRNTVFFKLSNGPTRLFFSMVLTPVQ